LNTYSELADLLLQDLAAKGDELAENELAIRYMRLVKVCARPYFLAGGDAEDLIQEGMLGLLSAIRQYKQNEGASFKTYAELCILNRLKSAVKNDLRLKHSPLNNRISLDDILSEETKANATFIVDVDRRIPEEQVLARESKTDFYLVYSQYLSRLENDILSHYLDGLSYKEISAITGRSLKSVDNAVQRIRHKLARHINPGDNS